MIIIKIDFYKMSKPVSMTSKLITISHISIEGKNIQVSLLG